MARKKFEKEVEELHESVLQMGEVVGERLRMGLNALETGDIETGEKVRRGDDEINDLYLEIENSCVDLLALQQPVAGDLRFVVASFKIITDLERIGDIAANLGEYATESEENTVSGHEDFRELEIRIQEIGMEALSMVEDAMKAYRERDVEECYAIAEKDDEIDARCKEVGEELMRRLVKSRYSKTEVEGLLRESSYLLLAVRDIERVGDHAVNISGRTLYAVESDAGLIH